MRDRLDDEWRVIETLLPSGWEEAARARGAFERSREFESPCELLRVLLSHASHEGGTRSTAARAKASGLAAVSGEAIRKRLSTAGEWLGWIASELSNERRATPVLGGLRPKAIDSTTIEGPGAKGTEYRLHYVIDLASLQCDWHELTDVHGGERIERAPVSPGDLLIGDRNFLQPVGMRSVLDRGGHTIVRVRANHPRMLDARGRSFVAVEKASKLKVGQVGDWQVDLVSANGVVVPGRVIALRLPAPLAARSERRMRKKARRKQRTPGKAALLATQVFMLFTTLTADVAPAQLVLDLYRFRWQIEIAFKRLKQILGIGHLPHKVPRIARSWILAKLVVALLLEKLHRNGSAFSPWGYELGRLRHAG